MNTQQQVQALIASMQETDQALQTMKDTVNSIHSQYTRVPYMRYWLIPNDTMLMKGIKQRNAELEADIIAFDGEYIEEI